SPGMYYAIIPVRVLSAMMIIADVHDPEHQERHMTIEYIGIALLAMSVGSLQYLLEYGQREDWFDSRLMIFLAVTSGITGIGLIWRELTTKEPVIDFRVLKHRPMWVGTVLGVVMGVGLHASVFTAPVVLRGT